MKIALLTSGGDAPGMNAAIRAVVRTCVYYNIEAYGVRDGYKGLVEDNFRHLHSFDVGQMIDRGGTILGSARLDSFKNEEVVKKAIDNLRKRSIDGLVVIGGDGTFKGAMALEAQDFPTIGIPATIDNDINGTEYTIGFFSALDTSMEAIDKLRDTSFSHQRCTVVEVMGRDCGDLSIYSGISCGAEIVVTSETGYNETEILERIQKAKNQGKRHLIVVVAENITDVNQLAKKIQTNTGYDARATVLGYIQRGGSPSAFDRVLASKMGILAVELLKEGKHNLATVSQGLHVNSMSLSKVLYEKADKPNLYRYLEKLR
ncbi:6-phosphofructokinase [Hujiaoplasma nucleasis]|uniref:ATP-dependent 6-phosphofructokinase n=1 Tax=Hujiaoplasma nucleasis TaxID=2725268 RepID=A0A7L6N6H2_9MOLU|nr:6-phosphofructokinase [Hujiaoplasma nucleasis]QLY40595.1 6-phosphofructokinase [Hujiaoplasma nucleasis]